MERKHKSCEALAQLSLISVSICLSVRLTFSEEIYDTLVDVGHPLSLFSGCGRKHCKRLFRRDDLPTILPGWGYKERCVSVRDWEVERRPARGGGVTTPNTQYKYCMSITCIKSGGEKWHTQCWPRFFYSQGQQQPRAITLCLNPPPSPVPLFCYLQYQLPQSITPSDTVKIKSSNEATSRKTGKWSYQSKKG